MGHITNDIQQDTKLSWGSNDYSIHIEDDRIEISSRGGEFKFGGEVKANFNVGSLEDATLDTVVIKKWLDDVKDALTGEIEILREDLEDAEDELNERIDKVIYDADSELKKLDIKFTRLNNDTNDKIDDLRKDTDDALAGLEGKIILLDTKTGKAIAALDAKTGKAIAALDVKTGKAIAALDAKTGKAMGALDKKTQDGLTALDKKFSGQIKALEASTEKQIYLLDTKTGEAIEALSNRTDEKINALDKKTQDLIKACCDRVTREIGDLRDSFSAFQAIVFKKIESLEALVKMIGEKTGRKLKELQKSFDKTRIDIRYIYAVLRDLNKRVTALEERPIPPGPVPPRPVPPRPPRPIPPAPPTPGPTPRPSGKRERHSLCDVERHREKACFVAQYKALQGQKVFMEMLKRGKMKPVDLFRYTKDTLADRFSKRINYVIYCIEAIHRTHNVDESADVTLEQIEKDLKCLRFTREWRWYDSFDVKLKVDEEYLRRAEAYGFLRPVGER